MATLDLTKVLEAKTMLIEALRALPIGPATSDDIDDLVEELLDVVLAIEVIGEAYLKKTLEDEGSADPLLNALLTGLKLY